MNLASVILFVISTSIDNLTIAISYGAKKIKINLLNNLVIAVMSFIFTYFSMGLGKILSSLISQNIADYIGNFIIIGFGIYTILSSFKDNSYKNTDVKGKFLSVDYFIQNPEKSDLNSSGVIDFKEAMLLGLILDVNNMGLGLGAGISGLSVIFTSILSFFTSILSIWAGCYIGRRYLSNLKGRLGGIISGILIVLIGIFDLIN